MKKKPIANNPNNVSISELFCQEQDYVRNLPRSEKENFLTKFFIKLDNVIKLIEPQAPSSSIIPPEPLPQNINPPE